MWTYSQTSGIVRDATGPIGVAYSGHGQGLDDPADETIHDIGPIPSGLWTIGPWHDDTDLGPCVAALTPVDHDACGRTGFYIHGDSQAMDHSASHGCIVASKNIRHAMRDSGDTALTVTA